MSTAPSDLPANAPDSSKTDAPLILGVSGLRGIAARSLTPELAARYTGAFARWLDNQPLARGEVLVVRDGRAGGEAFEHAAMAGLLGAGCTVATAGVATTPAAAAVVDQHDLDGAVIVTASHNPQEWNGLKLLVRSRAGGGPIGPEAAAPAPDAANEIIRLFKSEEPTQPPATPGRVDDDPIDAARTHADAVGWAMSECMPDAIDTIGRADFRVVVDSVNASGARAVPALFGGDALDVHAVQLFGDPSGVFPHTPEPTRENLSGAGGLCQAVPGLEAFAGFAQDPDADRLAIIDERGEYIGEEYTLALCALALLSSASDSAGGDDRPPVLVTNLSTSRMLDDLAPRFGGRVVRTPVGEAHVVRAMKDLRAQGERVVLGGEGNGGVIWPEVSYVRDSVSAMALVLAHAARTGRSISDLVADLRGFAPGGASYSIEKRKTPVATKADAEPAVQAVRSHFESVAGAAIDTQDGVRVDLAADGAWLHVRASNTEPILRLIAEAPSSEAASALLDRAERAIQQGG